jgi:flagellar protein FlgJ
MEPPSRWANENESEELDMTSMTSVGSAATGLDAAQQARADARLKDGAQQFEAMMLGQILKPLQFGTAPGENEEESGGGANDTIRSFGTEAMAKAIASRGGFGIANLVLRQVTAEHQRQEAQSGGTKV